MELYLILRKKFENMIPITNVILHYPQYLSSKTNEG